ncbi:MAG: FG-GAP repeat domain-containing protein [Candidatus Rokuibacteriota bacterium]
MLALTPPESGTTLTPQEVFQRLMELSRRERQVGSADAARVRRLSFNARERNLLFVNARGRRFIDAGYPLGIDIDLEGRGVAVADLDQDGGLDLVVRSVARQKLTYLHNEAGTKGRFLRSSSAPGATGTRSARWCASSPTVSGRCA